MNTIEITKDLSYFTLRLQELLNQSYPELANDKDFIINRSERVSQTYSDAIRNGNNHLEASHLANEVLFANLPFSKMDMVFEIVSEEFNQDIPDAKLRSFAEKMYPICLPVFEKYDIEKQEFVNTNDYTLLYTELTGTIQIWLEENGKV